MRNSNHQIGDFGTPRYVNDPQNDVDVCERCEDECTCEEDAAQQRADDMSNDMADRELYE